MHIPDNYLSPSTCAVFGAAMLPVWKRASNKIKEQVSRKKMPLLGVGAAFSFLIMMFNLPLPGGTTGHAVGAALIAILLGPYAAVISVTIALVIQALFFGDGGILALGANTFNMAFIMPFTAYYVYNLVKGKEENKARSYIAAFLAGYISLNVGALFTAFELGIQPYLFKDALGMPLYNPYGLKLAIPAMLIPHMLVAGVVEGMVTSGVYGYVKEIIGGEVEGDKKAGIRPFYLGLILMAVISPLGLLASGSAWGEWGLGEIEKLAGFAPQGMKNGFNFRAVFSGYSVHGFPVVAGYIASALLGVLFLVMFFKGLSRLSSRGKASKTIDK